MICYLNGEYKNKEEISLSPDDRGFLFADGLYEVVRGYDGVFFRMDDHLERLAYGAKGLGFIKTDFSHLAEVGNRLLEKNKLTGEGDAIVYYQITRGVAPRGHAFPPADTPLTEYAFAKPFQPNSGEQRDGIRVMTTPDRRWARCNLKTIALLPNTLAHQQAKEHGCQEGVFARDGAVMEGTHSNIFFVMDGALVTPPLTNYILGGITRKVVLEICRDLELPVRESTVMLEQVRDAREIMMVGTTLEITPVIRFDNITIGDGAPGPICRKLQGAFAKQARGQ